MNEPRMLETCPHCGFHLLGKGDPASADIHWPDECPRCGTRVSDYLALYGDEVSPATADEPAGQTPTPAPPKRRWNLFRTGKTPRALSIGKRPLLMAALAMTVGLWVAWTSFRSGDDGQTTVTGLAMVAPEPTESCNVIFEVGCIEVPEPSAATRQGNESALSWSDNAGLRQKGLCGKELLDAFKSATGVRLDWQAADLLLLERLLPPEHVKPMQDEWMQLWKKEAGTGSTLMGERIALGAKLTELMAQTGESETSAKVPDDEYFYLRNYLFSTSRQELNVQQAFGIDEVWVAVMETTYADHSLTLVTLADGDTALWHGTGGGRLAECDNFETRKAAVRFVDEASRSLQPMEPYQPFQPSKALEEQFGEFNPLASLFPLPERGNTRFYIMSRAALHTIEIPAIDLEENRHPLSRLFHLGQDVIATIEGGVE